MPSAPDNPSSDNSSSDNSSSGEPSSDRRIAHFDGLIPAYDRDRLRSALRRAERTYSFPPVPLLTGAAWVVVAHLDDAFIAATRLGVSAPLTADSVDAFIARLDAWCRVQSAGSV
jgi:hypothetical protein